MHTNVSTKSMREEGGLEVIKQAVYKLGAKHMDHIAIYGEGNELRLTGKFETASMDTFSYGVANRGASIRIGRDTEAEGMGYFEDRRVSPPQTTRPFVSSAVSPHSCPNLTCYAALLQRGSLQGLRQNYGDHHGPGSSRACSLGQGCGVNARYRNG
jgi:hypothetical protein